MNGNKPVVTAQQVVWHALAGHRVQVYQYGVTTVRVWCESPNCQWNRQDLEILVQP